MTSRQGVAAGHGKSTTVRPILFSGKPAEHLQLVFPLGTVETSKENVLSGESRGDQPLPSLPRPDLVCRAIPERERARAGHPAPDARGRAVLVVLVVHAVLRSVRTEVHGRVLVGVEGLSAGDGDDGEVALFVFVSSQRVDQ